MKWYIAKIVYEILNNSKIKQFDEQLRVIEAENIEEAFLKSKEIAHKYENEFFDLYNNKVVWKFRAISYLSEIAELKSGTELYSQIIEKNQEENYLKTLELKQESIILSLSEIKAK